MENSYSSFLLSLKSDNVDRSRMMDGKGIVLGIKCSTGGEAEYSSSTP